MLGPGRDAFIETFLGYQGARLGELHAAWDGAQLGQFDGRTIHAVEVGCGPIPALGVGAWASARAFDPLAQAYVAGGLWVDPSNMVEPVTAAGEALPIEAGVVDLAICENALDHVEDPAGVCHELARVLRPGGKLWLLVDEMDFTDELHTGMRKEAINELCAGAGLRQVFQEVKPTKSHPMADGQVRSLWVKDSLKS